MSKNGTPITRAYWNKIGGTLVEEFPIVNKNENSARRIIDGLIIIDGPKRIAKAKEVSIKNKDVVCIQTKASRLGIYLMGQALFSKLILERYHQPVYDQLLYVQSLMRHWHLC